MIAALIAIAGALGAIAEVAAAFLAISGIFVILFDPKGKQKVARWVANIVGGGLSIAVELVGDLEDELAPIANAFLKSANTHGAGLLSIFRDPAAAIARTAFTDAESALITGGKSTPETAVETAGKAMGNAFGFGLGSAAMTALFEAMLPEKLNTFNAVGPMLAHMAGFKEVARNILDPMYDAAFGQSLKYHYRSVFKPELPNENNAVTWHARRLLSDAQLRKIFSYSGLKDEYEEPYVKAAYRPLSPFILGGLGDDTNFDEPAIREACKFIGFRDQDIDVVVRAIREKSVKSLKAQLISAYETNIEAGIRDPHGIDALLDFLGGTTDAAELIVQVSLEKRLKTMTEDYRSSWDDAALGGEISAVEYQSHLAAIGYVDPVLSAQVAKIIAKVQAKGFIAAEKAAERLAQERQREAIIVAMEAYRVGKVNAPGLTLALVAARVDPTLAALYVQLAVERGQSILLRQEEVRALSVQVKKKLVSFADALKTLKEVGIGDAEAKALVAGWAASLKVKLAL